MAQTNHYVTPDVRVYSDDTDVPAIIWVGEIISLRIIARLFVFTEAEAAEKLVDAIFIADQAQTDIDFPPSDPNWAPGKTGIAGLPVV